MNTLVLTSPQTRLISTPKHEKGRAILCGLAVGLYVLVSLLAEHDQAMIPRLLANAALGATLALAVVFIGLPRWLYQGHYTQFSILCIAGIAGCALFDEIVIDQFVWPHNDPRQEITARGLRLAALNVLFAAFSIAAMVGLYDNLETRRKFSELAELDKQAELDALKAQLNPHLLLNSLNNVYGLALEQDPRTPETVLKLANILRYSLYEADTRTAPLEREIEILESYVRLQEIGLGESTNIDWQVSGDPKNRSIGPLLILPLVENAFKHGDSTNENSVTGFHFRLEIEADAIHFSAINPKTPFPKHTPAISGIGLENLKARLALLYPERHSFNINTSNEMFFVSLSLYGEPT